MIAPVPPTASSKALADVRTRIVVATAGLLASGGRDAATTRAITDAAGVQAPTIYRLFKDKRGLLDAVAQHELAAYVSAKAQRATNPDPVQDLRDGWDMHIAFGLAHPEIFAIMSRDRHGGPLSPAIAAGEQLLREKLKRVALAGNLRVSEDRAAALLQAGCNGTVFTLLNQPVAERDAGLSATAREAMLGTITGDAISFVNSAPRAAATMLRASLDRTTVLTDGERRLLEELLNRIADDD